MTDEIKIPKALLRPIGKALVEHKMIQDGDRVLLGLSGGKDSLSLLHILRHFQRHAPVKFELGVMTVDPEIEGFDPELGSNSLGQAERLRDRKIPVGCRSSPSIDRSG